MDPDDWYDRREHARDRQRCTTPLDIMTPPRITRLADEQTVDDDSDDTATLNWLKKQLFLQLRRRRVSSRQAGIARRALDTTSRIIIERYKHQGMLLIWTGRDGSTISLPVRERDALTRRFDRLQRQLNERAHNIPVTTAA